MRGLTREREGLVVCLEGELGSFLFIKASAGILTLNKPVGSELRNTPEIRYSALLSGALSLPDRHLVQLGLSAWLHTHPA
jgi:hypothetical protein